MPPEDASARHLVWSPAYTTDLTAYGVNKPFALDRGQCVLDRLAAETGAPLAYVEPAPLAMDDLLTVHTAAYLESLNNPAVWAEIFELKDAEYEPDRATKPLNELFDDIRLKAGGTLKAAELALAHGLSANLGGGYHHAYPDRGRGFCVLHDIAVAIRVLQRRGAIERALVVDLDFHQGDGTAVVFAGDRSVFTLSVHSEEGWPEEKQESTLDVPIRESEAYTYLERTRAAVADALARFSPDLVVYVAGSDPYELDVLPGTRFLKLTLGELKERDEFVIDTIADRKIPLAMVFAGGYGDHVWQVHYQAVRRLLERASVLTPRTTSTRAPA